MPRKKIEAEIERIIAPKGFDLLPMNVLLDSGAYTAWRSGKPINIEHYCSFIERNTDWIGEYAALDVIDPGNPEAAAAASFENLLYMRNRGLKPMPIFHIGENIRWLDKMLDLGVEYVGLSASSIGARSAVDDWYSLMFRHICDGQGRPLVRTHAFGEGRIASLKPYPWASADTATGLYKSMRNAFMLIDPTRKVSQRNDRASQRSMPDLSGLDAMDKATFARFLERAGAKATAFDPDPAAIGKKGGDMGAQLMRSYMTAFHYIDIGRECSIGYPKSYVGPASWAKPFPSLATRAPVDLDRLNFHLVIGQNAVAMAVVAALKAPNVLVSYAHLPDPQSTAVRDFVYDPVGFVSAREPFSRYYNILKDRIHAIQ